MNGTVADPARTLCAKLVLLLAMLAMLAMLVPAAGAAESILAFDSRVEVQRDGGYRVTETIEVRAEGAQIRRGIFRDFPTYERQVSGLNRSFGFDVESVKRDGRREPWHSERIEGGERVYIGDADVHLSPGVYRYELVYRTSGQLGRYPDFDEVYWNVTGNGWTFPIEHASATIVLPEGATPLQHAVYTGERGAKGQNATVTQQDGNRIRFETTQALGIGRGLTVAVSFAKGFIEEPTQLEHWLDRIGSNVGLLVFALAPLPMAAWFLWAWLRVGRDPPMGVVIPLFEPPDGISPAAAAYVFNGGTDATIRGASRAVVAALMSLAIKGRIRLDEAGRRVKITRLAQSEPDAPALAQAAPLPPGELALFAGLLARRDEITLERGNAKIVRPAIAAFTKALSREYERPYFRRNYIYMVPGVAIAGLALAAIVTTFRASEPQQVGAILSALLGIIGSSIMMLGVRQMTHYVTGGPRVVGAVKALIGVLTLAATASVCSFGILRPLGIDPFDTTPASMVISGAALLMAVLCVIFFFLLFAPTPAGRELADRIAGFRQYLAVAEAERMNLPGQPDFSTTLFERYLPYAIALGVEKPWSNTLEHHLAQASPQERSAYRPSYFHGSGFGAGNTAGSVSGIASTLGASVAAAAPSSSSGSSGGGSSGGGGGGGGGGGW
ncbi:MAG: DUF2207 domain-containing protein [Burkholderiaceae bacterium]